MSPPISLPTSRRAIVQDADGKPQLVQDLPIPPLAPGMVLVKSTAVALNPSEFKMSAAFPTPGAIVGNDFSGTIVSIAEGTDTNFAPGDSVLGVVRGSDPTAPDEGAFTSHIIAPASLLLRIPPPSSPATISVEQASTFGTALATCTLAIWDPACLNLLPATPDTPAETPTPVLIYGGSTATGTIAIQLLKLSGLDPIAICSPHNFDLVRGYGASAVFDYARADLASAIRTHTNNRLEHVIDCIADIHSVDICTNALGRTGGRYVSLQLVPDGLLAYRRAVHAAFVLAHETAGTGFPGGYGKPADPDKHRLAVRFWGIYQRLLDGGRLRAHPTERVDGGLGGVIEGLELLKTGTVSGKKLVVVVED